MFVKIKKMMDKSLEILVMVVVGVLVIDVLWQVFTRKVLGDPSKWTEELAIFLLIWVSLLGAAVALRRGAHLGIDYFVEKLAIRTRLFTEVIVFALICAFSVYIMIIGGIDLVLSTLEMDQRSSGLNIPVGYVYLAVPISGAFMTLYSLIGFFERRGNFGQKCDESLYTSKSATDVI
ncbi:MAG: TRAP transporter small permease [Phycisphaerae bacterium]|nr:TRAP transporter small permease [Phycisphaerae bacterium]